MSEETNRVGSISFSSPTPGASHIPVQQTAAVYQMREFTEQQQKCLRGEHETETRLYIHGLVCAFICKYCRCLYVEKT